jgi:hypothetical protein
MNITGAFVDYYHNVFVKDNVVVSAYDLNNNLIEVSTIEQGQAVFANLVPGNIYRFDFSNPNNFQNINLPFPNFFLIPLGSTLWTVPVFFTQSGQTYTNTTNSFTLPISGTLSSIGVLSVGIFHVGDYIIVANTNNVFIAFITNIDNVNNIIYFIVVEILIGNSDDIIPTNSLVLLSRQYIYGNNFIGLQGPIGLTGLQGQTGLQGVSGIQGPTGITGPQGTAGAAGIGPAMTLAPIIIYPIGTKIQFTVTNVLAFPVLSYILISDSVYSISGQVVSADSSTNTLSIRINSIINAIIGLSISAGAIVTFTGAPGPAGTTNIGDFGTSFYHDNIINNPALFYSNNGISQVTTLSSMNFYIPNNTNLNYKVIFEFDGNVFTNQQLHSSNIAYLGVASNASKFASDLGGTFAGVTENISPAPVIDYPNMVTDGVVTVGTPVSQGNSVHLKFVGTFGPETQVDFTLVGCAVQSLTSFYVTGMMTATCYPLYE